MRNPARGADGVSELVELAGDDVRNLSPDPFEVQSFSRTQCADRWSVIGRNGLVLGVFRSRPDAARAAREARP